MSKLYFGKISKHFPQQYENNFYAGGKEGNTWYNGLKEGDYVFPIYQAAVNKLWRVKGYNPDPNEIDPEGSIVFEVVKTLPGSIPISTAFTKYKHFELNLTMLNKSVKHTVTEGIGFYEITCDKECPPADSIDFSDLRNLYMALEKPIDSPTYKEGDIRILIDSSKSLIIKDIQVLKTGQFVPYEPLYSLYLEKNEQDKRYSLKKLLEFAKEDEATNKESFLKAAIDAISQRGVFSIASPIALYDNILVGRKKTAVKKKKANDEEVVEEETDTAISIEEYEEYQEYIRLLEDFPNLILYGPPGTGKTYSARKIVEAFERERINKNVTFKQLQDAGRVSMVTFHQSFSYEEFVEGLRPVISSEDYDSNGNENNLKYKIQDGVLKQIANKAALSQITAEDTERKDLMIDDNSRIWKISLGERHKEEAVYESCINTNTIAIGWFNDLDLTYWNYDKIYSELTTRYNSQNPRNNANSINNFVNEMQEGDIVLVFASTTSIRAIGVVEGPYVWQKDLTDQYPHRRDVKWIKIFTQPVDIIKYNGNKKLSQVTLYELSSIKFLDIKELLESDVIKTTEPEKSTKNGALPYFMIIDEINRGNISKIFGELITLIEKDKRNNLKVILPYSQKPFSLPDNLYFIGTMNTADRSIAVLDTALRRRFIFKEIEPSLDVIRTGNNIIDGDLDLSALASILNKKIATMIDRDHRLGHSYFMGVYDINQFKIRWYYQIIPLLMEYFYNDAESIEKVISAEFIDKQDSKTIWIFDNSKFKTALNNIKQ
jgi:5-methylcytosine-specific restriction protein B